MRRWKGDGNLVQDIELVSQKTTLGLAAKHLQISITKENLNF